MALRLGDLLVQEGLITELQLDQALRNQQIFGGRLGTNLVELGFVSETQVAALLSKQLGLPAASPSDFEGIAPEALKTVTREMAEKYRVIPLVADQRSVRLAMSDPTDLRVADEVRFSTGLTIEPVVAPEILISYALESCYGVPRDTRYLRVAGATGQEFEVVQAASYGEQLSSVVGSNVAMEDRSQFLGTERKDFVARAVTMVEVSKALADARAHDDVFATIRRFLAQHFRRSVVFAVRGDALVAWVQHGADIPDSELRRITIPVMQSKLLHGVWKTRVPFVGKPSLVDTDRWLFEQLALSGMHEVLCVPVPVNGRPFCTLLGVDPTHGEAADRLDDYDTLAKKVSYAAQMLFFRKRLLAG